MKIDTANLPSSTEELKKMILTLLPYKEQCELYRKKYEILLEEIRLAKQRRFAPSSEKDLRQLNLFDEAGVELPESVEQSVSAETVEVQSHTRKKHPVREKLPADLPREVIVHDIPEEKKTCSCGSPLHRIGEEVTEQLKYIPAQISVVRHVRPKYACKPCQENVKIADLPRFLLPKSMATPELIAYIIVAKYCDHLPLYRQEKIWQRIGVTLPRSSLCRWVLEVARLCEPLIKILTRLVVAKSYLQADETPVQVLSEAGRENTSKSYMWCYRSTGEKPIILYDYQETRGGYHAERFLSGFCGYLQTDAYSGYRWVYKDIQITPLGCNAHARRPFAELVKLGHKGLAQDAVRFYRELYAIEKEARENQLSYTDRFQSRREKATPIWDKFKKWLDHHATKTSPQAKIGKAIHYCLRHWNELTTYLKDGQLEIDNNLIENSIRPFALGKKNWLFMGSPEGAKAGAILYSLIETAKANGIEPYHYLCAMLNRLPSCTTDEEYQTLLPQFIEI